MGKDEIEEKMRRNTLVPRFGVPAIAGDALALPGPRVYGYPHKKRKPNKKRRARTERRERERAVAKIERDFKPGRPPRDFKPGGAR